MNDRTHLTPDTIAQQDPFAWLKDHIVHIMVLSNGIILTIAIFFTVQLFIGQMLKEDYLRIGSETKQVVGDRFADFQNSMVDFSSYFQEIYLDESGTLKEAPKTENFNVRLFDSLLWIPVNGGEAVDLKIKKLSYNPAAPKKAVDDEAVRSILKNARAYPDIFLYASNTANNYTTDKQTAVQNRPFAIVKPIRGDAGETLGYLAAFSSIEKILLSEQILSDQYVTKTVFWNEPERRVLFFIQGVENGEFSIGKDFQYDFASKIGGSVIRAQVIFKKGSKNVLLELLPFLVAGFGIIVTIFAWFYALNNHKKSRTLSLVNAVLAVKNEELNDQIREREKLFQTLRKSERENHAIINAISDVIFEVSPTGEILFLNEAWSKITGFDLETSMGRNLFEMIYPQDQDEQKRNIASLAKGHKTAYTAMTKLRTIEGTYRSVEIVVSMLRQDESKNLRVVGSFTDIEERQRAEQALNEAEKKYKTIWENAAGGIYQLTPQGQFVSANPALARIFGYDSPEHLMKSVQNAHEELFLDPAARAQFLKSNMSQSQDAVFYESQAVRKNGEHIWVRENFRAVLDGVSKVMYYEGSIEDITQRKESEVQLKEAKVNSDMASRAKSEFLANISHELRTPLNSIIGFSEIIRNEVFGPIEPKSYTEYASNIFDSGKHLLGIINQILDISRIDAGERELNESLVDVRKIATICLDLTRAKISQGSLTIIDLIPENLPRLVAEEVAVKQMLLNLLSNAAKFTAHGGRITLNAEVESSGGLRISVTDTGVGLTPDQIEKSAMPFGLVDGRLDKGTGGAGLGLSLIHSLLRLHGGKLEILSQKGIGTTASLLFPKERIQS